MERRANPTPLEQLVALDQRIAAHKHQRGELQKLRRLLIAQLFLFEKVGRRADDQAAPSVIAKPRADKGAAS